MSDNWASVANVFWQKTHTRENRTDVAAAHDHVLLFARNREVWKEIRNVLPASDSQLDRFTNPDNDERGPWASLPAHAKAECRRRGAFQRSLLEGPDQACLTDFHQFRFDPAAYPARWLFNGRYNFAKH